MERNDFQFFSVFTKGKKTSRITNDDGPSIIVFESREGNFIIRLLQRLGDRKSGLVKKKLSELCSKTNNPIYYFIDNLQIQSSFYV